MKTRVTFMVNMPLAQMRKESFEPAHADLNQGDIVEFDFGNEKQEFRISAKNEIKPSSPTIGREVMFYCVPVEVGENTLIL